MVDSAFLLILVVVYLVGIFATFGLAFTKLKLDYADFSAVVVMSIFWPMVVVVLIMAYVAAFIVNLFRPR